jgi:hypothetical protein
MSSELLQLIEKVSPSGVYALALVIVFRPLMPSLTRLLGALVDRVAGGHGEGIDARLTKVETNDLVHTDRYINELRDEVNAIRTDISNIRERLASVETRLGPFNRHGGTA